MISDDVIDVVEHLVVLLKDGKKMGREECQMLLAKLDRAREEMKDMAALAVTLGMDEALCDCAECRKERGE